MAHPLVTQLRFARSEFVRCLEGISDEDARHRIMPMNCISWMIGHMAAHEQYHLVFFSGKKVPHPQLNKLVGFGQPATTPPLDDMWKTWHDITAVADSFLDTLTTEDMQIHSEQEIKQDTKALEDSQFWIPSKEELERALAQKSVREGENNGTKILRITYHYFFHTGEAHAVRQQLGHPDLPFFVGAMPDDLFVEQS
ncbi:MAG: DinB family protein [Anaerolineales bacterium]|jgi:hypothetical protein